MRKPLRLIGSLTLLGLLWPAASTVAHHSFAVHFEADKIVEVQGIITDFRFTNPHGVITWVHTNEQGEEEEWRAETNSPNVLRRRGWSRDSLQAGDEVTVTGFMSRDGSNYMRVSRVDFADGRELVGQSAGSQD